MALPYRLEGQTAAGSQQVVLAADILEVLALVAADIVVDSCEFTTFA